MPIDPIIKETTIHAPASAVWKALTDVETMKEWYFAINEFKAEPGFEFHFFGGDESCQYYHACKVMEVKESEKLVHTWSYPQNFDAISLVTWEIFAQGDHTMVRLIHNGVENFGSGSDPNFSRESFDTGWEYIVKTGLKDFLEKDHF